MRAAMSISPWRRWRHSAAKVVSRWTTPPGGSSRRSTSATDFPIEPDASAATYLWAAEALTRGRIDLGVPMDAFTQPDASAAKFIRMFPRMPAVIDGSQMQDAVPTLAVLAAFNDTPVRFVGIANLRVKECDRIAALATELSRIQPGLAHEEGDDLVVSCPIRLRWQMAQRNAVHADRDLCRPPDRDELCAGRAQDRRHRDRRPRLRRQDLSGLLGCAALAGRRAGARRPAQSRRRRSISSSLSSVSQKTRLRPACLAA